MPERLLAGTAHAAAGWRSWLLRAAWALVLALPLLWQLGGTPLFDVDEGAFSEATREMLVHDDWGHTTLNGAPRYDKPIGIYWLQATSVSVFGLNDFALRLPSALACWAMALALAGFAVRRMGLAAGALAGLVTVTSIGFQAIGRAATADGVLNLLLVLAGLDLWRFLETQRKAPLRRAYAWVGLGLLVKGPIAVLVPGAAFLVWILVGRRWRLLRDAVLDLPGWLLLLAIAVPWYVYAWERDGMDFVRGFLLKHNVERFTGTIGGHGGTPLYYLLMLPVMAMPWGPLVVAVALRIRSLWAEPLARYLLGWGGFVLLFFSLSGTKLPHYVLYGYAPLVLLMARALAQASPRLRYVVGGGVLAWAALAMAAPWIVLRLAPQVRDPLYHALLGGARAPALWPALVALVVVAVLALGRFGRLAAWAGPAAAAGALAVFLSAWLLPWFGETLQGPIQRAAAVASTHGGRIVQWQVHWPTFSVAVRRETPRIEPAPADLVLTRSDRAAPYDAGRPRLFEERGVLLLGPRAP